MSDVTLSAVPAAAPAAEPGLRDHRRQTPLWRVSGRFRLVTPLHIGTGQDEPITLDEGLFNPDEPLADTARHVATVVRDHAQHPCIPASSFKGALLALARRAGVAPALQNKLFGAELAPDQTQAGAVEFGWLYASPGSLPASSGLPLFSPQGHPHVAHLPHVSRNRDTGAAEAQRLFLQQVLPPGVSFGFECTARGLDSGEVSALLGLLALAGHPEHGLRLGAGQAADQGRVEWQAGETRRLDSLAEVWKALSPPPASALVPADLLWSGTRLSRPQALPATPLAPSLAGWLTLPGLTLQFHSPFLVYQRRRKAEGSGEPDGAPRTTHEGRAVLPASSLHGALRSQAERILRTIGRETPAGYAVPGVSGLAGLSGAAGLDLASVLFGAAGWRSLLRCADFSDDGQSQDITHHMLAIDRLTGGGKDSAKFAVTVRDCPTLQGTLALDLARLHQLEPHAPGVSARVLGLLAHVLRDLDEGDIPLGYGASKGYGQQRSRTAQALAAALQGAAARQAGVPTLTDALQAFAALSAPPATEPPAAWPGLAVGPLAAEPALSPPPAPAAAEQRFHNPYVFIPFGTPRPDDPRLPWVDQQALREGRAAHHSHARYHAEALHGRLVCRVRATTPIFIGAGDKPGTTEPKQKEPFRLRRGSLALPATSLRGLLGSLHESVTGSRLRAATDRHYSVRYVNDMNVTAPNPSAIGRLIRIDGLPGLWLQMLALPLLTLDRQNRATLDKSYQALIRCGDAAPFKSLFGDATTSVDEWMPKPDQGRPMFHMEDRLQLKIQQERGGAERLYIDFPADLSAVHTKIAGSTTFVLGERRRPGEMPQRAKPPAKHVLLGLVRAMRVGGGRRDLADTRKHEVFIPYGKAQQDVRPQIEQRLAEAQAQGRKVDARTLAAEYRLLPVPDEVVERFCRLADEMTATQDNKDVPDTPEAEAFRSEQLRPYQPRSYARNSGQVDAVYGDLERAHRLRALRPQHNDLVYFRPNAAGTAIEEISYSSMWRREVARTAAQMLGTPVDLLPDGQAPVQRLSPSELLFGSVQVRERGARSAVTAQAKAATMAATTTAGTPGAGPGAAPILAWMSKVRVGHGISLRDIRPLPEVTLKILSSPKPPSPSMYFQPRNQSGGAYVSKAQLWQNPSNYQLKGRKTYLHAWRPSGQVQPLNDRGEPDARGRLPWVANPAAKPDLNKQKVRVAPLPAGSEFIFDIDFHNLSQTELETLCACLRPHAEFEHKLGMGKPIGLGSVKLDILGLHLINRRQRYQQLDLAQAPRYQAQWRVAELPALPAHLAQEATGPAAALAASPEQLARAAMETLRQQAAAVHQALVLSGSPGMVVAPVHYPQEASRSIEEETFAWFVNNDKTGRDWSGPQQYLQGFTAGSQTLPTLSRTPRKQQNRR